MDCFVEVVGKLQENADRIEDEILKYSKDKGEFASSIDLSKEAMEAFLPNSSDEIRDLAKLQDIKRNVLMSLGENIRKKEESLNKAKGKHEAIKGSIGALKFVLPAALNTATIFFPVVGGAAAVSAVAWKLKKILDTIVEMKDSIDRLTTSDYKSAMVLFKDIIIQLTNNVYPQVRNVETLYVKAVDGYHKLDDAKFEEKLELLKIQMFCTIYTNCFDEEKGTLVAFHNVSENKKNIIQDIFIEKLKDFQKLCFSSRGNTKYQNMLAAIDHIKKTSYSHIIIEDTIYQAGEFAVKVWSLRSYMVPEGEANALFSSMHTMKLTNDQNINIQASLFTDENSTWFLNIHLPSEDYEDYEDVSVICQFQKEDTGSQPAILLPSRVDNFMWKVNTSFLSDRKGKLSFFIFKPGDATVSFPLDIEERGYEELDDLLPLCGHKQMELVKEGFQTARTLLENKSHSVATVICLMNLNDSIIKLSSPAMTSGYPSEKTPWPQELPPLSLSNLVARKANYSAKGCAGATILRLNKSLHILLYWCTPYDQNWCKNCFGVGYYSGNTMTQDSLLEKIRNLPEIPLDDLDFHLHQAEEGPVCIEVTNNWRVSINMTTIHKAVLEVILIKTKKENN
eukprot:GFUD01003086.1.p1 GENE.GFUD01003086.1~~GFUD01003086.1.p1  ORF type:complete len:622 (-),score=157.57 GFUD01003086.1:182-2047(-)